MTASLFKAGDVTSIETLLNLVSHGNAIIAEILRLKDNIPAIFSLETKQDQAKYGDIILDLSYFKNSDAMEKKITNSPVLQELDDDFKKNNNDIVKRFYLAFESIYQYVIDLNLFLEQLADGVFIQQSVETILQDIEGKQLLCESLYLYGAMLLVCEAHLPGKLRERILVAHHRTSASDQQTNMDKVCKLLGDTGYRNTANSKRPSRYPEDLFKSIPIDEYFIETVIGRLRDEDIYNQVSIYPESDHRSTALASQASMLVVCLFFSPNTLVSESSKMREIVDKYFPDNWIVSVYMGITLNLIEIWEPYKAAKSALVNTLNSKNIKDLSQKYSAQMRELTAETARLLQEGALEEKKVMEDVKKVLNLIRACNVTLKWVMLHANPTVIQYDNTKKSKQIRDQIILDSKYQAMDLFQLLINTSLMELRVKEILKNLLNNREIKWEKQKNEVGQRIVELSEAFSGEKPLLRVTENEGLAKWFKSIKLQIDSLKYEDMGVSSKEIGGLIHGLEYVQEFHQLHDIMQVKQWLNECREGLHDMMRGGWLTEKSLVSLQIYADLSYGWYAARSFTTLGREALKKDPTLVSHLRAVFLKLASALEIPLMRINQAGSADLLSVSQYYSNELVAYVREVLQIIPETVFSLLERIIELQTSVIRELPTRLDKDKLKEYAQLDERMEVAKLTHSVSVFTSGILKMRSTLVGVICIDPKQLLEDGIRREVSRLVKAKLETALAPSGSRNGITLAARLLQLAKHMDGYRRSFEYIQDYINIHGLKIWQEEVSKIIGEAVDEECSKLRRLKDSSSGFTHHPNMFGCLVQDIYSLADPKATVYVKHNSAWFDAKYHHETISPAIFRGIYSATGAAGLRGVTRLLAAHLTARLDRLAKALSAMGGSNASGHQSHQQLTNWILDVGTCLLLAEHGVHQLNTSCKFDSCRLQAALEAVDKAIMNDMKSKYESGKPYPHQEFLLEVNELMQRAGISHPCFTIYVKMASRDGIAKNIFLTVIGNLPKLAFYQNIGCLTANRTADPMDGAPFVTGVSSLIHQYHPDVKMQFLILLCERITTQTEGGLSLKLPELLPEVSVGLRFLEMFCEVSNTPKSVIESFIPINILAQYEFMSSKTL